MKKGIKYGVVFPGFFILGIIFLVLVTLLLIQTEPAKRKIARVAETEVNKLLNGNLSIGKIEGNFFTGLSLQNVLLTLENDTLAQIEEIKASYNLWPLLRNTLDIYSAEIIRPKIFLKQVNDSVWNVQQIVKPGTETPEDEPKSTGNFNIRLPVFRLVNGLIRTETQDTVIPQRIENLNTELSVSWTKNQQQARLKQFSFSTKKPDFSLNRLEFNLSRKNEFIELSDFRIETAINQLTGEAGFSPEKQTGNADFEIQELKLSEFNYFLPYLKFPATPQIKLQARMDENLTRATLQLADQNQQIYLQASLANLAEFLFSSGETILSYTVDGKFTNVDLVHWLGLADFPYTLNGNLSLNGSGIEPETAEIALNGVLNNWVIQDRQLDKVTFDLALNKGNLSGLVQGNGAFGNFRLNPSVQNLFGVPVYKANFSAQNLNLERLTGIADLNSEINLTANISGKEFAPEKMSVSGQINILNSRFQHITIDSLIANAAFQNQNLKIDTFRTKTPNAVLTATGNYSLNAQSDLKVDALFTGVDELYAYLPDSNLHTSGTFNASLRGRPNALSVEATAQLDSSSYGEIKLASLTLFANGQITVTDTLFDARVVAHQIQSADMQIDSLTAAAKGNPDSVNLTANLAARELNSQIDAEIFPGELLKIDLNNWKIDFRNQTWTLQQPPATIGIDAQNYTIENFKMLSNYTEQDQFISAHGVISRQNEQNFNLEINGLNLESLMQLLEQEQAVSGLVNVQLNLAGKPDSLLLNTGFSVENGNFDKLLVKTISGNIGFSDDILNLETRIALNDTGKIDLMASVPFTAKLDSMTFGLNKNEPVEGSLNIEKISLAILEELEISDRTSGIFESEIKLSGSVTSPAVEGKFTAQNTDFNGYAFSVFDGTMNYRNNIFSTETLVVPQDSGRIELTAEIPVRFNPDSLTFDLNLKDSVSGHLLIDRISLELLQTLYPKSTISGLIEGDVRVSGTAESPDPTGNIQLKNAVVQMKEYGIDYKDIGLSVNFLRNQIELDKLLIRSADGNLTGSGRMDFASDFYKGDVSDSEIELNFNRFQPFNHRQFNMEVNGNATLGGKKGEVIYGGNITIPRSEIFIPTVLRMLGRMYVPELPKPVLVEELEKMEQLGDSLYLTGEIQPLVEDTMRFDYFDNFRGNMRIRIPRNTWIKNDDMYIEISGDVELRKSFDFFELFGSVDVVRGQYDLLGKTFQINEGSISFQGGEEMMPYMDIKASYSFRNQQRVEQELSVHITGKAETPEVNFQLDGSSISEGDALSYLLFGKSMNELTIDEQDNVSGAGSGSLAGRAAASILSSQLTNFLGEKLAVDYIEVKSDGGFDNATVVVGKYITNDLFVSYEQRFGETHEENLSKYEVKLEYELFRFLFFELNNSSRSSGFDVIFKFDAK